MPKLNSKAIKKNESPPLALQNSFTTSIPVAFSSMDIIKLKDILQIILIYSDITEIRTLLVTLKKTTVDYNNIISQVMKKRPIKMIRNTQKGTLLLQTTGDWWLRTGNQNSFFPYKNYPKAKTITISTPITKRKKLKKYVVCTEASELWPREYTHVFFLDEKNHFNRTAMQIALGQETWLTKKNMLLAYEEQDDSKLKIDLIEENLKFSLLEPDSATQAKNHDIAAIAESNTHQPLALETSIPHPIKRILVTQCSKETFVLHENGSLCSKTYEEDTFTPSKKFKDKNIKDIQYVQDNFSDGSYRFLTQTGKIPNKNGTLPYNISYMKQKNTQEINLLPDSRIFRYDQMSKKDQIFYALSSEGDIYNPHTNRNTTLEKMGKAKKIVHDDRDFFMLNSKGELWGRNKLDKHQPTIWKKAGFSGGIAIKNFDYNGRQAYGNYAGYGGYGCIVLEDGSLYMASNCHWHPEDLHLLEKNSQKSEQVKNVVQISCGYKHIAALTKEKNREIKLWVYGENRDSQLGLGFEPDLLTKAGPMSACTLYDKWEKVRLSKALKQAFSQHDLNQIELICQGNQTRIQIKEPNGQMTLYVAGEKITFKESFARKVISSNAGRQILDMLFGLLVVVSWLGVPALLIGECIALWPILCVGGTVLTAVVFGAILLLSAVISIWIDIIITIYVGLLFSDDTRYQLSHTSGSFIPHTVVCKEPSITIQKQLLSSENNKTEEKANLQT